MNLSFDLAIESITHSHSLFVADSILVEHQSMILLQFQSKFRKFLFKSTSEIAYYLKRMKTMHSRHYCRYDSRSVRAEVVQMSLKNVKQ